MLGEHELVARVWCGRDPAASAELLDAGHDHLARRREARLTQLLDHARQGRDGGGTLTQHAEDREVDNVRMGSWPGACANRR